jgi:hypothetical protein
MRCPSEIWQKFLLIFLYSTPLPIMKAMYWHEEGINVSRGTSIRSMGKMFHVKHLLPLPVTRVGKRASGGFLSMHRASSSAIHSRRSGFVWPLMKNL